MDLARFSRLQRYLLAAPADRRELVRGLAALPLLGAGGSLLGSTALAKPEDDAQSERKKGPKRRWFCLNNQSIRAKNRKRKKKLHKQGATRGKCPTCTPDPFGVTCAGTCTTATNNCGDPVICGFVTVAPQASNLSTFGTSGPGIGQLSNPYSVTVSKDGLVAYVPDYSNDRISIWTRPDAASQVWTNTTTFGVPSPGLGTLSAPADLTFSNDELIMYIADYDNDRITIWTRPDATSQIWSNPAAFGQSSFNGPVAVQLSSNQLTMFVAEYLVGRVSVWTRPNRRSTSWRYSTAFGSVGAGAQELTQPSDIALSSDDLTVWVADSGNNRISVWSRPSSKSKDWANAGTFGANGSGAGEFSIPYGVTLSANQRTLWIGDSGNNRVSVWSRTDTATQNWAPLTTFGDSGPNPLSSPEGLSFAADEQTIWIADKGNNRISVWSLTCPA